MIAHPDPGANVALVINSTDQTVEALQNEIVSSGLALDGVRFFGVQVDTTGAATGRAFAQAYLADDANAGELAICNNVFAAHA